MVCDVLSTTASTKCVSLALQAQLHLPHRRFQDKDPGPRALTGINELVRHCLTYSKPQK